MQPELKLNSNNRLVLLHSNIFWRNFQKWKINN